MSIITQLTTQFTSSSWKQLLSNPVTLAILLIFIVLLRPLLHITLNLIKSISTASKLKNIPSPPTRYPFSHFIDLMSGSPWDVLMGWLNQLGPILKFQFGTYIYIVTNEPTYIERILNSNRPNYIKDLDSYFNFLVLLGNGLITSEGDEWFKQRSLVAPVFRQNILMETALTSIAASDRLTKKLVYGYKANANKVIEMGEEFRHLTLQVIGKSVLSMTPEECDRVFPALYLPIADEANHRVYYPYRAYLPTLTNLNFHIAVKKLNEFVVNLIKSRQTALKELAVKFIREKDDDSINHLNYVVDGRDIDILDRIILACYQEQGTTNDLDETTIMQLRDQIKTFIFAGHETSSMMLTWALFELTQNPECMKKVREEAKNVWGSINVNANGDLISTSEPSYEFINMNLNYTVAVLRETLRKWSVVPLVTREAKEDDKIGDFFIPKGSKVVVHMKGVHHRADIWPEPETFKPERFLEKYHPYSFLPFIQGPRNCVGQHFALLEAKIVLSRLVLAFDFECIAKDKGKPMQLIIPVAPENRMSMTIAPRKN